MLAQSVMCGHGICISDDMFLSIGHSELDGNYAPFVSCVDVDTNHVRMWVHMEGICREGPLD